MRKLLAEFLTFGLLFFILASSAWAGQVVTDEVKEWAKKTLEEEKALQAPEGRNTLAVLYFQNKTGQTDLNPLQKGFTLMLITDLSKVSRFQVIERVRLQALVEEMGLRTTGLVDPETAPRVGKLLGAEWIVGGEILKGQPERLKVEAHPLEVSTQKVLGQPIAEGKLEEVFRMEKDLLFDIVKMLNIDVKPVEGELRMPCSTNVRALMLLFRGVDASDSKDYERAAEFYGKALEEDPKICAAGEALKELHALGLVKGNKKSREMLRSLRDRSSLTDQLSPEDATKRTITPSDIRFRRRE